MRVLFCSPILLSPELGMSKAVLDLAGALREQGCECDLISPADLNLRAGNFIDAYPDALARFLDQRAGSYDVVEYDYAYLPFERKRFAAEPLFVARVQLLQHQLMRIHYPRDRTTLELLKRMAWGWVHRFREQRFLENARITLKNADISIVLNQDDRRILIEEEKLRNVHVIPNGLSAERAALLAKTAPPASAKRVMSFIGTFDFRKGAIDFPMIFSRVADKFPDTELRLLGTEGLFRGEAAVLDFFPLDLRRRVRVIPRFKAADLSSLLGGTTVGIFPSYIEGFGLGVLEMLAAGIPVIAYRAPGPPEMLTEKFLVESGDVKSMAERAMELLDSPEQLVEARRWASARARDFGMDSVARLTIQAYEEGIHARSQNR